MELLIVLIFGWLAWVTFSMRSSSAKIEALGRKIALLERRSGTQVDAPDRPESEEAVTPMPSARVAENIPAAPTPTAKWGSVPAVTPTPARTEAPAATAREGFEKTFGTRWTVWLGGFTIALGAIFLAQYSVQQGYFGPAVRIFMSALLSVALLAAGELTRRRPQIARLAESRAADIPPILTAAGLVAAYATIYAAFALYGMIGPAAAFALLGLLSFAAMLLAGLHASYVGAIGLIGAVLAPALIEAGEPRPEILFLYLTFVLGTSMVTSNLRGWRWLDTTTIALGLLWPLIWITGLSAASDTLIIGLHMLALHALRFFLNWGKEEKYDSEARFTSLTVGANTLSSGGIVLLLLFRDDYGPVSLYLLAIYATMNLAAAWPRDKFASAVAVSAPLTVFGLALWASPDATLAGDPSFQVTYYLTLPVTAETVRVFLTASGLAGLLYGLTGYVMLASGRVQAAHAHVIWATVSAFAPLVLFIIAYARVTMFDLSVAWGAAALLLAMLCAAVTRQLSSQRSEDSHEFARASFATATLGFLAAAFAITLRNEWLTVALALLVPGLAWVQGYLPVRMLERLATALVGIVIVRLVLNPSLLDYEIGTRPIFNGLLYTYGLPTFCLGLGAWLYRHLARHHIADMLESGALLLGILLLNLEINHGFSGGHAYSPSYGLAQHGAHLIVWLFMSLALYRLQMRAARWHYRIGATVLRWLSYAMLFFGLTAMNPLFGLFGNGRITAPLFFDPMFLAYFVPCLLLALYTALAHRAEPHSPTLTLGSSAFIAGFTYYSLEVRRLFHDGSIGIGATGSEAETYAYSVAWLLLGGGLLAAAFVTRSQLLRITSLAVVMLVIGKVFLYDMAGLTGVLRAASFLGLGVALIGIGLFYQKAVFRAAAAD